MNKIVLILIVVGFYVTVLGCKKKTTPPNILFIMADDLGIKDLGCYGSDYYLTPNLDKLAEQGMRFTRAYAGCHVCSPTRGSILTGQYPHRVHLSDALPWDRLYENPKMVPPDHLKELPSELPTFAKALQSSGYKTAFFGKWHLGNEYQFFAEGKHKAYGFDEAFPSTGAERKTDKCVEDLTEHTLAFLESNAEGPFMLCLMHHTPHVPLACPPEYEAMYNDVPKGQFQKNQKYAGMISHLDQSMKLFLDKLKELGLDQNTVVIFTSDNGGLRQATSNKPFNGAKGDLYEGGIRVPLIVRWPEQVDANSVCNAAVHSTDYFPTFLSFAGLNPTAGTHLDGCNMIPLLKGGESEERTFFWHFPHRQKPSSAVMDGDWKLIHYIVTNQYELFDLKTDPWEETDLTAEYPSKFDEMKKILEDHLQSSGAQRMRPNPNWDPTLPPGKMMNFGIYYPAEGGVLRMIEEPYPDWFKN